MHRVCTDHRVAHTDGPMLRGQARALLKYEMLYRMCYGASDEGAASRANAGLWLRVPLLVLPGVLLPGVEMGAKPDWHTMPVGE